MNFVFCVDAFVIPNNNFSVMLGRFDLSSSVE